MLGAPSIGIYNYTVSIVTYFSILAATGTATYGKREIAIRQHNIYERSTVFWEILFFRIISTLITLVAYLVFVFNFLPEYRQFFIIQLFSVLSWAFDISWFFQGMENFKVTVIRNAFTKLGCTLMIFTFVKTESDLWIYVLIYSASFLFSNLTMWAYLKKEVIWIKPRNLHILVHFKEIFSLFIPVIAIQLYTVLDKTMLGLLDNTTSVGYYSQADKIIKLALTIISSFISVLMPRIALLFNQGDKEKLNQFIKKSINYILLLSLPMMFGCIMISDVFVPVFFGRGYEPVVIIMQTLSVLFIILSLGRFLGTLLVSINQQKKYTLAVTFAAIINLILNTLFIVVFQMSALGVAIASVIAELLATIIQLYYTKDFIKAGFILKSIGIYLIPSIIMIITILAFRAILGSGLLGLIIQMLIGIISYFGVLLLRKDETMYFLLMQLKAKLKPNKAI